MAPLEVCKPFTPPSALPSPLVSTRDTSSSSRDTSSSSSDDDSSAPTVSRARCKHPGRRIIGGRIYDSVLGVTCHWCRQKTVEDHVYCCHCTIAFCGGCLRNRHGEDIEIEMQDSVEWTCPKCRGGCGPGCNNCCNCGPCRKSQGLDPTGLLVHTARARGFTNVHDYLIYQKTGECEEIIARRKRGKGWCQTDPTSFRQKQKRIENENTVEASCRKRLNFDSSSSQLQKQRPAKLLHSSALQKEVRLTDNKKKVVLSHDVQALKNKLEDKALSSVLPETVPSRLKPVADKNVEEELQCKVPASALQAGFSPSSDQERKEVTCAQLLRSKEDEKASSEVSASLPHQHVIPPLDANVEPNSQDCSSHDELMAKKEWCEPELKVKMDASNTLLKVKMEDVPLGCETSVCKSASIQQQQGMDQPAKKTNERVSQLLTVKEEVHEPGLQPHCDHVSDSANVQGDKNNFSWCTFSLDCVAPSENTQLLSSSPRLLFPNDEPHRDGHVASPSPSNFNVYPGSSIFQYFPGNSNFQLYPEGPSTLSSFLNEEEHLNTRECKIEFQSVYSQEAQCNTDSFEPTTMKGCKDIRCSGCDEVDNFVPLAAVKEEREDFGNVPHSAPMTKSLENSSQSRILFDTAKVKAEKEDVSFTIEPVLPTSYTFKTGGRLEVKEEFIGGPLSSLVCIEDDGDVQASLTTSKRETSAGLERSGTSSFRDASYLWKVDGFSNKLEARLSEPFSEKELEILTVAASHRKPIYKARETRQGSSQFLSEEEGYSYLDHHPDLTRRLEECDSPIERLSLLRGFFFWLEHASTQGAFKPWTSAASRSSRMQENDDCVEIDGPDCEILAVVCSVD